MVRSNLSTRPFYNERIVHAVAAVIAVAVLAGIAWEGVRIVRLSRYKTELSRVIDRDTGEMDKLNREAAAIRRGLNQKELSVLAAQAREANDLIEQRTFSWTGLFNQLEATLPEDVMLTSVHPDVKDNVTEVTLELQSRTSGEIDTFWDRLEATGAFHDIQWQNVSGTDDGLRRMSMQAVYAPPGAAHPAAAVALRKGPR